MDGSKARMPAEKEVLYRFVMRRLHSWQVVL
jgi:hypothetical protein